MHDCYKEILTITSVFELGHGFEVVPHLVQLWGYGMTHGLVVELKGFVMADVLVQLSRTGLSPSLMGVVVMVCLVLPKMIRLWRRLDLFGSAGGWRRLDLFGALVI